MKGPIKSGRLNNSISRFPISSIIEEENHEKQIPSYGHGTRLGNRRTYI